MGMTINDLDAPCADVVCSPAREGKKGGQSNRPESAVPRATVLMAVYNGEAHLVGAVASILSQDFVDFEFLTIDDASTDSTPSVLGRWEAQDPRIRVIRNDENAGLGF